MALGNPARFCDDPAVSRRAESITLLSAASLAALVAGAWVAGHDATRGGGRAPVDFDAEIRPILADNCLACHGADAAERKAGLRLDQRSAAIAHGAISPWRPDESSMVARVLSRDPSRVMPPPESHRTLRDDERALLARWIAQGARYDEHWAFTPPVAPALPAGAPLIDTLVRRRLAREGLDLAPEAPRETLVRRVTLDLTGLPPTPAEIDAFLADREPGAYERVVDRLLASPHYGERMALPWLDAARYADSNGFQQDGDTFQWVWRDWLVRRLNDDMPYDRLSTEMLAGDLLPDASDDTRLGTAFLRNHLLNGEGGAIPEENRFVALFDRVDATATTWLGLTMSCAQCHDHKYDPITQRDYYAWLDAFNRVSESGVVDLAEGRLRLAHPLLDAPDAAMRARRDALEGAVRAARETLGTDADSADPARKAAFDAANGALDAFLRHEWPRVMVMRDDAPRETRVLSRGAYLSPLERVSFETPAFLPPASRGRPGGEPRDRLALARWLFSPENPLVARVAANRAWQQFFGEGLVRTSEDFGVQGERPVHRELLDALAVELRESGWRMKALHRGIVTSAVYRQSSEASAELVARDPDNRLLARAPRGRLPSMLLRDAALAASGLLDARIGGMPVYPYQPDAVWEPLAITKERDFAYPASRGNDLFRRSIYTFWRRTIAPANMFDASQRQTCRVRVPVTSSPLHALTTLNDPTFVEAARALAVRVSRHASSEARVAEAFRRVLARSPDAGESAALARLVASEAARFQQDPAAARAFLAIGEAPVGRASETEQPSAVAERAALASACLAILNLDEAICRE